MQHISVWSFRTDHFVKLQAITTLHVCLGHLNPKNLYFKQNYTLHTGETH